MKHLKNFGLGLLAVLIYFIGSALESWPLDLLHIHYENWPEVAITTYSLIYEIILIGIVIFIFRKEMKENFIDYKNHANDYLTKYIKYWFLTMGLMCISNLIIQIFFTSEIAGNEQAVRTLLDNYPIYTFIASVVLAPLLEELIFRFSIRKMCFGVSWLFIILSGLIFGGMHIIGNATSWVDWLYIIPYGIPGCVFAYTLVKSNNIFVPITLHTIHNGILVSLQILLSLLA